jgi:hypothetical protein
MKSARGSVASKPGIKPLIDIMTAADGFPVSSSRFLDAWKVRIRSNFSPSSVVAVPGSG